MSIGVKPTLEGFVQDYEGCNRMSCLELGLSAEIRRYYADVR